MLADARLSLRVLHRDARVEHLVADLPDHVLLPRGLEKLVVLDGARVGEQLVPALGGGLGVGVAEQVELELGCAAHLEPALGGAFDLASEYPAWRHLDRSALEGE